VTDDDAPRGLNQPGAGQQAQPWPGVPVPDPPPSHGPPPGYGPPIGYAAAVPPVGGVGQIRPTGKCILLAIVTLGIYTWVWFYRTHEEMKRHTGDGLGGTFALILAIFVGFLMPFLNASEVGKLYERRGQRPPVNGLTGLWYIPGFLLFYIGPIVWFVKTNRALNDYWASLGARRA